MFYQSDMERYKCHNLMRNFGRFCNPVDLTKNGIKSVLQRHFTNEKVLNGDQTNR
jgi:hypothetical protein